MFISLVLIPMLGLAIASMNMVVAYLPSVVAWHLALRLTLGWLGRRRAVRVAAAATAVTASLILSVWASLLLQPWDQAHVFLKGAVLLMVVSVLASVWTADGIEGKQRR